MWQFSCPGHPAGMVLVDQRRAAGGGHEQRTEAEEPPCRCFNCDDGATGVAGSHVGDLSLARRGGLGDGANIFVWYVDYRRGKIGLVVEGGGFQREWDLPSGEQSRPYGMAIDKDDRVWLVEPGIQPNRFIGFDTESEEFIDAIDVPSGGGTIRHMHDYEATDAIWFGTDVNTVGRAVVAPRAH